MASAQTESRPTSSFRVQVLGPFALERDGVAIDTRHWQRRVGSLFKLLATAPGHRRLRDEIIEILWPDSTLDSGAGNLRIVAHRLRLVLGGGERSPVLSEHGWMSLNPSYQWSVDLQQFEELADTAGDDVGALEAALALYRGEPLVEERYEDWAMPIRERVERRRRELALRLAGVCLTGGSFQAAIRWFEHVLESDPIDEEAIRGLLSALYRAGRRADALRRYQQFEQRLFDEMGVPPSAETMMVVQQLHEQFAEPSLAQRVDEEAIRKRPLPIGGFLGALPDGPIVGREEELERISFALDAVEGGTGRFILLSGEQGGGKTRLAQEAMLRLRDRGFVVGTGRCYEREQSVSLYPFVEAVRLAHDAATPTLRLELARQWQHLGQLLPALSAPESRLVGTATATLGQSERPSRAADANGRTSGPEERQHLFRTIDSVLVAIAAEKPLALLLDDLHWADGASLDLLLHLARHTRSQRLLLLGTYRDEALDRDHPLAQVVRELAREGLVERIPVRRLSLEGTAALVAASVGEMEAAEEFSEFVYRRTKGIPYYIDKLLQGVGGRYCLVRQIGAGGMGRVFEAIDSTTGEAVAAKIMFARTEADPRALQRFEQEGAVLAQLAHPNIVRVYGTYLEEHANTIVMELVEGISLGQLLRQDGEREGTHEGLPLPRIKELAEQVAAALACAHSHGIVHRDIKPDNIMVGAHDQVKVTDFGIARLVRPRGPLTSLTSTGMTLGTPLYMAPEQIEGRKIDGRTDIYSLGCVLYELATGRPPFEGHDPVSVAFKHVHEAPAPPRSINAEVPADWERLILKALAKDPGERFQTAEQLEEALGQIGTEPGKAEAPVEPVLLGGSMEPEVVGAAERLPEPVIGAPPSAEGAAVTAVPAAALSARGGPKWRAALVVGGGGVLAALVAAVAALFLSGGSAHAPGAITGHKSSPVPAQHSAGRGPGQFLGPTGVTVDGRDNVYGVDQGNNRVEEFTSGGRFLKQFVGTGLNQLNAPTNVAVASNGTIFIADFNNARIQPITPDRRLVTPIVKRPHNSTVQRQFNSLTIDAQGHIWATDYNNNQVLELTREGRQVNQWGRKGKGPKRFEGPKGIAVGVHGDVYVADSGNNRIQVFTAEGTFVTEWGSLGPARGQFNDPNGLAIDKQGNVYVADKGNDRIQKFSSSGRFLAVIGAKGPASAHLLQPNSVAVDGQGYIYVSDFYDNRIEKFSPSGTPIWATSGKQPQVFTR